MDTSYYQHQSMGTLLYDPGKGTRHFDPWFAMLLCDDGIIDLFAWFMNRYGMPITKGFRWGAHVTFVRGEQPAVPENWGKDAGLEVPFHYASKIHWTNGYHAWVDVWCPRLTEIRRDLGLVARPQARYHLALGRLVHPCENIKTDYGDPTVL